MPTPDQHDPRSAEAPGRLAAAGRQSPPARRTPLGRRLAAAALAASLLGLAAVAVWSTWATSALAHHAGEAGAVADALTAVRLGIEQERSAERLYQLQPSPAARREHAAAAQQVTAALGTVVAVGDDGDRVAARQALSDHAAYLQSAAALFGGAAGTLAPGTAAAQRVAVALARLDRAVDARTRAERTADGAAAAALLHTEDTARLATTAATVLAGLLLLTSGRLQSRWRRSSQQQAQVNAHQAQHDALTGLPNRLQFQQAVQVAIRAARSNASYAGGGSAGVVTVALLDLDHFKDINDTLGHHYGDLLLQQIGPRVSAALPASALLARLGGDEFALLLSSAGQAAEQAREHERVVQRVLTRLRVPFDVQDVSLVVEASAGLATLGLHGDTPDELLQHADTAMYVGKAQGADLVVYDPAEHQHSPRRLSLLSQLRTALEEGQLVLHYQPLVDLGTGVAHGVEALVRWQHPVEGLLGPGEFLPLAEGSGLIHDLTRYVLQRASRQAAAWRAAGTPLVVSVNVSARCLLDATLPMQVRETLRAHDLDPALIKIEITESAIIADPVRAQDVIHRLHGLGVRLSIDDFGTGYTSLSYLRDLPVDELKIDRTFVATMLTNSKDAVIVRTGVELASRLGLTSVAEGIEDPRLLEALRALGCTTGQGYLFSRPLPPSELSAWLRTQPRAGGRPGAAAPAGPARAVASLPR